MNNRRRVALMTRIAVCEKEQARAVRISSDYFRGDYIGIKLMKNFFRVTAAYVLGFGLWVLLEMDFVMEKLGVLDVEGIGIGVLASYGILNGSVSDYDLRGLRCAVSPGGGCGRGETEAFDGAGKGVRRGRPQSRPGEKTGGRRYMNIWKLKTYLEELYSRHYRAVVIAARMAAGFLIFFSLNSLTGYNSRLGNPLLLAGLSIASGFFPGSVTLLAASCRDLCSAVQSVAWRTCGGRSAAFDSAAFCISEPSGEAAMISC